MKSILCCAFNSAVLAVMLFFSSCSDKSDNNKAVIKALQESMESSNASINMSSTQILYSLDDKSRDYITKDKAGIWLPRAQQIQKLSEDIFKYIEGLKKISKVNAKTANELFARLTKHKEDILSVDSSIRDVFAKNLNLISMSFDTTNQTRNDFYKTFFKNSSALSTSAMLTKLQNNIKVLENKTITFCHEQISVHDHIDSFNEALVGQNSKYVKAGEKIEITAGVLAFRTRANPIITINRNKIVTGGNGISVYSFKASNKPGKHFVPVKIEFTDQNGIKNTREFTVEYTVAKECDQ